MSTQPAKTRQLYTRHYMAIIVGVISSLITVLGAAHDNIPAFSTYLFATGIPDAILILDWILARINDKRGLSGISIADIQGLFATVEDLKSKFPTIQKPIAVSNATEVNPTSQKAS